MDLKTDINKRSVKNGLTITYSFHSWNLNMVESIQIEIAKLEFILLHVIRFIQRKAKDSLSSPRLFFL